MQCILKVNCKNSSKKSNFRINCIQLFRHTQEQWACISHFHIKKPNCRVNRYNKCQLFFFLMCRRFWCEILFPLICLIQITKSSVYMCLCLCSACIAKTIFSNALCKWYISKTINNKNCMYITSDQPPSIYRIPSYDFQLPVLIRFGFIIAIYQSDN